MFKYNHFTYDYKILDLTSIFLLLYLCNLYYYFVVILTLLIFKKFKSTNSRLLLLLMLLFVLFYLYRFIYCHRCASIVCRLYSVLNWLLAVQLYLRLVNKFTAKIFNYSAAILHVTYNFPPSNEMLHSNTYVPLCYRAFCYVTNLCEHAQALCR